MNANGPIPMATPKDRMVYEYDFACPPDDVGGVSGYAHFLQVMRQPQHSEHEEMMEWHGGPFDPEAFDLQAMNRAFHGGWAPTRTANLRMQGTALKRRP